MNLPPEAAVLIAIIALWGAVGVVQANKPPARPMPPKVTRSSSATAYKMNFCNNIALVSSIAPL